MNVDRNNKKHISVLQTVNEDLITGDKDILQFCRAYFQDIYTSKVDNLGASARVSRFLGTAPCPRLSESDKPLCDGPITNLECLTALNGMLNNKAPSVSGFSKEFFIFSGTK